VTIKTLDALGLASMDIDAQIKRIAAIWCREMGDSLPSSRQYLARWVKRDYGPVLDKEMIEPISVRLLDEVKLQARLRLHRRRAKEVIDPLAKADREDRVASLLRSSLGPASTWASKTRMHAGGWQYIGGRVNSGLIAGIIPVAMRFGEIVNPNLLVYRERGHAPQSYWVSGRVRNVDEALVWVVPQSVKDLLSQFSGPNLQVELDYEHQACRVVTPYGQKLIPWRGLQQECE
jgi:hypothetical protein